MPQRAKKETISLLERKTNTPQVEAVNQWSIKKFTSGHE
jgi:hypothetical protein